MLTLRKLHLYLLQDLNVIWFSSRNPHCNYAIDIDCRSNHLFTILWRNRQYDILIYLPRSVFIINRPCMQFLFGSLLALICKISSSILNLISFFAPGRSILIIKSFPSSFSNISIAGIVSSLNSLG